MIIFIAVVSCSAVNAQIVMELNASGTVKNGNFVVSPSITGHMSYYINHTHWYKSGGGTETHRETWRGIMEFNLETVNGQRMLPTENMQSSNWSAWIEGMTVEQAVNAGYNMSLKLFDLSDDQEDGEITIDDYNNSTFLIHTLFTTVPDEGSILDNIDVTDALRADLFGNENDNISTGFILIPSAQFENAGSRVKFNSDNPRLVVNVFTPEPTVTPVPTMTPFPYNIECEIEMPSNIYFPYDTCWTYLWLTNYTDESYVDAPVFVILDVYGSYYFAPSFMEFDYYIRNVYPGRFALVVLSAFEWPDGVGSAENIRWWAAVTDPEFTEMLSNLDEFEFSWYE